jgi:hypothetical protein
VRKFTTIVLQYSIFQQRQSPQSLKFPPQKHRFTIILRLFLSSIILYSEFWAGF